MSEDLVNLAQRWPERDPALAEVERLTAERDAAQAEVGRLTVERDEALAERDGARRVRERLQDLLTLAGQELSTLRDRLRVRQPDPSASLTSSRPTDEDIWRELFMQLLSEYIPAAKRTDMANALLAEYRERWPQ